MRLIQHKKEAYWFYRFLSTGYDRWVNPLFWTAAMRSAALDAARLDERRLRTLDAGAGTGFTTEGIVERVDADCVTMLDQSPHQLRHAERKPALARCAKVLGDAEALPLPTDHFDRYVSAGSIEYWPAPERGIAEAYRVLAPGGVALVVGPVPPGDRILRCARRAVDAVPDRGPVPRVVRARGLRGRRARPRSRRLVPRPPQPLRGRGERPQAGRGPVAARAAPRPRT